MIKFVIDHGKEILVPPNPHFPDKINMLGKRLVRSKKRCYISHCNDR